MIAAVSYILYLDFVFLPVYPGDITSFLTIPFIIISTIFILTVLYIFPVFVHFQMTLFQVIKRDRKSTRLNSSHVAISYAVFCLKKKKMRTDDIYELYWNKN